MNKVLKNKNATAYFSPKEITYTIVNLADAKKNLTPLQYSCVNLMFNMLSKQKGKQLLDAHGFLKLRNIIMAHFDIVAPYYAFCGDSSLAFLKGLEQNKKPYRDKAHELILEMKFGSSDWEELYHEFVDNFYAAL